LIRAFVLCLVVTGFGAATVASHARNTTATANVTAPNSGIVPLCAPSDPTHCGLD
jgi:hypothetical protein